MNDSTAVYTPLIEPRIHHIFERKRARATQGPYLPKTAGEITQSVKQLLAAEGLTDMQVSNVRRMTGGASKEQFAFDLTTAIDPQARTFVLRMDPLEGIVETCRLREAELLRALANTLPVPEVLAVDPEGTWLGNPGLITAFVPGVTKPTTSGQSVSGIGSTYGEYASILAPQFVQLLANLHAWTGWQQADLPSFQPPAPGTSEAALYQVDTWARVWREDMLEPIALITLTELWLRENAPICSGPCLVHCDYRVGNFMFTEPDGQISAVLDWELAHFGDFHEDLAWILQKLFGSHNAEGEFMVCGLMTRAAFLDEYERLSGRHIDTTALRYYEILNAWKCAVMDLSSALRAGQHGNNHQDLLITWLGSAGAVFLDQIEKLLREA